MEENNYQSLNHIMKKQKQEKFYTAHKYAELCGIKVAAVYIRIKRGQIKAVNTPKGIGIPMDTPIYVGKRGPKPTDYIEI